MARGKRGKRQRQLWLPTATNIKQGYAVLPYNYTRVPHVEGRRKWRQRGEMCGHHAINNLFGKAEEVVTLASLVATAIDLNRAHTTTLFGSAAGGFHPEVIRLCLRKKGFDMIAETNNHGTTRDHMWLGRQTQGKFLALGYADNSQTYGHWIAIDADASLVIDSAERGFLQLDAAGVLKALAWGPSLLFRVTCSRHNHSCILMD